MPNSLDKLIKGLDKMKMNNNSSSNITNMFSKLKIGVTKKVPKPRERISIKTKTMKQTRKNKNAHIHKLMERYIGKLPKQQTNKNVPSDEEIEKLIKLYVPEKTLKRIEHKLSKHV